MNDRIKKMQEARKDNKVVRQTPIEKAKNNPKSLRMAITAKCWTCEGDEDPNVQYRIGNCLCKDTCPLWNVRPYQHLYEKV